MANVQEYQFSGGRMFYITSTLISALNENVFFCDSLEQVPEDNTKYIVIKGTDINIGENHSICIQTPYNELLVYNTETEEFNVPVDNLDSYGVDFRDFTVSADGTIYCTVFDSAKVYKLIPEKSDY